jgi:hypothetical protein
MPEIVRWFAILYILYLVYCFGVTITITIILYENKEDCTGRLVEDKRFAYLLNFSVQFTKLRNLIF